MRLSNLVLIAGVAIVAFCLFRIAALPGPDNIPQADAGKAPAPCETRNIADDAPQRLSILGVSPGRNTIGGKIGLCVYGVVSKAAEAKAAADGETPSKIELSVWFNGVRSPQAISADSVFGLREYVVPLTTPEDASKENATFWRAVLAGGAPLGGELTLSSALSRLGDWRAQYAFKTIEIALSRADAGAPETRPPAIFRLGVYEQKAALLGLFGFVALTLWVALFARESTLLRENGTTTTAGAPSGPYSLGRVQMAFWFVLITAGFLVLWLTIGQYNSVMTSSVLALIGISGTTGLAAIAINGDGMKTRTSKGFLSDIFSDDTGPQLHRIQAVVWTLILGLIFAWNVLWNFRFVDFDAQLLLLMAFVNGLYLGFKPKEAT